MRSFWSDPYLWIHLAGLAALPLFLELCLIGFSVGDPFLPPWLELLLVATIGIAPILWMQWQRPFYIFSLVVVALKPGQLTGDQRRLLTLFKSQRNRILAAIVPVVLLFVLSKIYGVSAIATSVVPFPIEWRAAGLLLAAIAFLGSNLFAQVPISVLSVMLNSESAFSITAPYPLEQIQQNFSLLGLQVNQILPPIISDVQPVPSAVPSSASVELVPGAIVETAPDVKTETASPAAAEGVTESISEAEASPSLVELVEGTPSPQLDMPEPTWEIDSEITPPDLNPNSSSEKTATSGEDIWEDQE